MNRTTSRGLALLVLAAALYLVAWMINNAPSTATAVSLLFIAVALTMFLSAAVGVVMVVVGLWRGR